MTVAWLLETHAHADHISAAPYLKSMLGGKIAIGREIIRVQEVFGKIFNAGTDFARDGSEFDRLFDDGDCFAVGGVKAISLYVPGHTPSDIAYIIGDFSLCRRHLSCRITAQHALTSQAATRVSFTGRFADFLALPDETRVFVCHDYKAPGREYAWETTVKAKRLGNIHLRGGVSEADFVTMRKARDATLAMPRLILPSVQVNMRGGRIPDEESNGVRYLKIPLNAIL